MSPKDFARCESHTKEFEKDLQCSRENSLKCLRSALRMSQNLMKPAQRSEKMELKMKRFRNALNNGFKLFKMFTLMSRKFSQSC